MDHEYSIIRNLMRRLRLKVKHTKVSDVELLSLANEAQRCLPELGNYLSCNMLKNCYNYSCLGQKLFGGYISSKNVTVARERIRYAHKMVYGPRPPLPGLKNRREYFVKCPQYIWHVDGHHKLKR